MRPRAIVTYERLYLAAFVLGLVGSALGWNAQAAVLASNPMLATMPWVMSAMLVVGIAISLTLWYFTARVPSVVAKWVVVVFAAFAGLGLVLNLLALMRAADGATAVLIADKLLYVAAAVFLFRPEARAWFGEDMTDGDMMDGKPLA